MSNDAQKIVEAMLKGGGTVAYKTSLVDGIVQHKIIDQEIWLLGPTSVEYSEPPNVFLREKSA